jgi:hypothetical protein
MNVPDIEHYAGLIGNRPKSWYESTRHGGISSSSMRYMTRKESDCLLCFDLSKLMPDFPRRESNERRFLELSSDFRSLLRTILVSKEGAHIRVPIDMCLYQKHMENYGWLKKDASFYPGHHVVGKIRTIRDLELFDEAIMDVFLYWGVHKDLWPKILAFCGRL